MRKLILFFLSSFMFSSLAFSVPALASSYNYFSPCTNPAVKSSTVCQTVTAVNPKGSNPIILIIKAVIEVISFITGAAAVILIVIAAIKFVTAGGKAEAVASARASLTYALIGVAVVVLAQSIVAFVLDKIK